MGNVDPLLINPSLLIDTPRLINRGLLIRGVHHLPFFVTPQAIGCQKLTWHVGDGSRGTISIQNPGIRIFSGNHPKPERNGSGI